MQLSTAALLRHIPLDIKGATIVESNLAIGVVQRGRNMRHPHVINNLSMAGAVLSMLINVSHSNLVSSIELINESYSPRSRVRVRSTSRPVFGRELSLQQCVWSRQLTHPLGAACRPADFTRASQITPPSKTIHPKNFCSLFSSPCTFHHSYFSQGPHRPLATALHGCLCLLYGISFCLLLFQAQHVSFSVASHCLGKHRTTRYYQGHGAAGLACSDQGLHRRPT